MALEKRAVYALIVLAVAALSSAVTYQIDRLNTPKPVIISDAVNVPPDPGPMSGPLPPSDTDAAQPQAVSASSATGETRSRHRASRGGHKKITSGVIHLNTATLEQLEELPGVGPSTAQAIIDFRTQSGRFESVDELGDIPRMGAKKLAKLMPFVAL